MTRGPCPGRNAGGRSATAGSTGEDPRRAAREGGSSPPRPGRTCGHRRPRSPRRSGRTAWAGRSSPAPRRWRWPGPRRPWGSRRRAGIGGRRQGDVVRRDGGPAGRLAVVRPDPPWTTAREAATTARTRAAAASGAAQLIQRRWPGRTGPGGRVAPGGQPQRRGVGGDLAGRIPQRGAELVLHPGHDGSSRAWPRALSARAVADLTELGRRPIRRAISRSGRSR